MDDANIHNTKCWMSRSISHMFNGKVFLSSSIPIEWSCRLPSL